MQHNKKKKQEEHADSIWKRLRLQKLKKSFASSTKMDFMNLRNESIIRVILGRISQRIPIGPIESDVFGLSNTEHLSRNAQS
jgi:hypothetical protein